jgi:hypothetical protein
LGRRGEDRRRCLDNGHEDEDGSKLHHGYLPPCSDGSTRCHMVIERREACSTSHSPRNAHTTRQCTPIPQRNTQRNQKHQTPSPQPQRPHSRRRLPTYVPTYPAPQPRKGGPRHTPHPSRPTSALTRPLPRSGARLDIAPPYLCVCA